MRSGAIPLPLPKTQGEMSLEEVIQKRKSKREFLGKPLTLEQASQILWASYAVPSAGALYPLEIYIVVGGDCVSDLEAGVYHYLPANHSLEKVSEDDLRSELATACLGQSFIAEAPVSLVIAADCERTTSKYGERGIRYVQMEAGHAAQNVYLEAASLGLGTVAIGAFDDGEVSKVLQLPAVHKPLYIMPIGYPEVG